MSWLLAGVGALAFAAFAVAWLSLNVTFHTESVDALSFHFPGVIRYVQSGSLWHEAQYLPGQAQGNYPQFGDMLMLALVLPWHSLAFVRLFDPVLLALAAVALYATAVELGAPKPTAVLSALAVCAIKPTLGAAFTDVLVDPAFLAGFSAGILFLVRHNRTEEKTDLVLAGLGLGLALGTKWYALTDVPIVIAVWIAARLITSPDRKSTAKDAAFLIGITAATGGVWLVRNLILTGNPVFDYKVGLFGATIFPAPPNPLRAVEGFSIARYFGHPSVLRHYVWPVFRSDFGLTGALLVVGAAAAAVRPKTRALAVSALLCAIAYTLTPYSAQGFDGHPILVNANTRYGVPALLLATPLLALAANRLPRQTRQIFDAILLTLLIIDVRKYLVSTTGRVVLSVALVIVAAAVLYAAPKKIRLALIAAAATALAALGYHYQRVLADRPYLPSDPTVDYVLSHAPAGTRIGMTGTWTAQGLVPVAPLFGPRLRNQVSYVGPWVQHRLEQYATQQQFNQALRRGRYTYLEIGTGFPPTPDPIQASWAAMAGYTPVASSSRLILMRRGPA
ncbi:MAG: phospholipid carrier-dependent glycosyltransferase [Solirubrobacteraceae bacterium]